MRLTNKSKLIKKKVCEGTCGEEKPLINFPRRSRTQSGYLNICTACRNLEKQERESPEIVILREKRKKYWDHHDDKALADDIREFNF